MYGHKFKRIMEINLMSNKTKKNILVISSTPTHPLNQGNRIRLFNLLNNIKDMGYAIFFLYVNRDRTAIEPLKNIWGDDFIAIPYKPQQRPFHKKIKKRILRFADKNAKYVFDVDEWYNYTINEHIYRILAKTKFDIVLAVYVYMSKSLKLFDENVLKIIDTNDKFTDRHLKFLKEHKKPTWFSTTYKQEKKGLKRADVIIAIQEKENNFFSNMLKEYDKKVITIGHTVKLHKCKMNFQRNKILFIGSKNDINLSGIEYFIENVMPELKKIIKNSVVNIAGDICNRLKDTKLYNKLGFVENIDALYEENDVIINPLIFGTGMKIKLIESLGYARPVVSTEVGAEGLEEEFGRSFLVAKSQTEFAYKIKMLLKDDTLYTKISSNAFEFAKKFNKTTLNSLKSILS